jgi:hypothetical protein
MQNCQIQTLVRKAARAPRKEKKLDCQPYLKEIPLLLDIVEPLAEFQNVLLQMLARRPVQCIPDTKVCNLMSLPGIRRQNSLAFHR